MRISTIDRATYNLDPPVGVTIDFECRAGIRRACAHFAECLTNHRNLVGIHARLLWLAILDATGAQAQSLLREGGMLGSL